MKKRLTILMAAFALLVFMAPSTVAWGQSYSLYSGSLAEGDYLIVYQGKAMKNTISSNRLQYEEVTVTNDVITTTSDAIVWHIAPSGNYWTIYNAAVAKYAAGNGTKNQATLLTSGTDDGSLWTSSGSSTYEFVNKKNDAANVNKNLRNNGTYGFACYGTSTGGALSLYKLVETNDPSITASNVSITYDATEGYIDYTINNPAGGTLTASSSDNWITNVSVGNQVHFNCYSNDGLERTATITLTYTYNNNQTVTKDVTVTQAADPDALGAINNPYTIAEARAAIDAGTGVDGVYATGIVSLVVSYNSTYHSITYWISDDGTQTNELEVYSGISGIEGWTFSSTNDIQAGATVVVYGNLKKYSNTYEFDLNNQLISYTAPSLTVATPTFSPVGGTYTEVQTVTISCETPNVTIYYTTDGTDPDDESTQYTGSITVGETMTIKAIAYDNNNNNSAIATATYTINLPTPEQTFSKIDGHNPVEGQTYLIVDLTSGRALTSANGSSSSPTAVEVTITNDQITTNNAALQWTFEATEGGYIIHPLGSSTTWLYSTAVNAGVRVGTNEANVWTLDITDESNSDYHGFKHNGTSRYLGVYQSTDWRAYTTIHANIQATQIALFVLGDAPAPAPSFTIENNNEIAYDATSGSFNFTINNAVEGGSTSVAENVDWISNAAISGNSVTFTTTTNEAATSREGIITLAYTYGRATVTKNVTVTQAGNPNATLMTIAEVRAQGTGDVATKGVVTSFSVNNSNKTTAYIQDVTAAIVVYGVFTVAVGDEIRVAGSLSDYNGLLEIINPEVTVISSSNTVNPQLMTVAEIVASTNQGWYIRVENATVTLIDGQNTTIAQDENTIVVHGISGVEYAVNDVLSLNGNIGCYNSNQIAHPTNITVQHNTAATITVNPTTINAPAEGAEGSLTITYQNITEFFPEVEFCDAEGNLHAEGYGWIDAEIIDNSVVYTVSANEGEARTGYFRVYATDDEGDDVYSDIVTVNQEEYVAPTYAELPFSFNGGRDAIENTDGLYQEGLGTDYNASTNPNTQLKFDGTGDWLLLQFNERPGKLTFDIKGNTFSGGTFTVQTSEDGVTYTDLATYTELGSSTFNEEFNNLGENVRYIKWIYTEKVSGNVGLGNIVLLPYTEPQEYTLTIGTPENVTITAGYGTDGVLSNGGSASILEGTEITLVANVTDGYVFEGFTVTDADGQNITLTEDPTTSGVWSFYMPSSNVTVNASATIAPVVTTTTYTLATAIESGKTYIIVGWADGVPYAMGEQNTNNRIAQAITVDGSTATVSSDAGVYEFVVASLDEDYYSIFDGATPGYLYAASSGSNHLRTEVELDENHNGEWKITIDSETGLANVIADQSSNRNVMQFNNGNKLFSCYASASQHPVYFYVKDEASTTVTQTVELTAGANWFSTYLDITLEDLQTALATAMPGKNITIKSPSGNSVYSRNRWNTPADFVWDVAKMYYIIVTEDCEITLEGMPLDPAEHPITIVGDGFPNWIGFPFSENMTLTEAFGALSPVNNDIVKKSGANATYSRGRWNGGFSELEPGQGYIYVSAPNSADRVLTYPAPSKAKNNNAK